MGRNITTISDKINAIFGINGIGIRTSYEATRGSRLSVILRSFLSWITGGASVRLQVVHVCHLRAHDAHVARMAGRSCRRPMLGKRPSWRLSPPRSEARTS
jgi:hypothetical protein